MKKLIIAAMTGDQASHWPVSSLSLGPFVLGRGWERPPVLHTPLPDGTVVFAGNAALNVLLRHEYIVLQHWPEESLVGNLQASGRKVGFWLNVLSTQTAPYWNLVQEPIRQALQMFPLLGTDGKKVVTWPGATATDIHAPDLPTALAGTIDYVLSTSYRTSRPDFFFIDEMTDEWYCTAPNAPSSTPSAHQAAVNTVVEAISGLFAPVWGHNSNHAYEAVRRVVHEHSTRGVETKEMWVQKVKDLASARPGGSTTTSMLGLGWEKRDDVPASWCDLMREQELSLGASLTFQTARTGKAFQIFDPFTPSTPQSGGRK